MHWLCECNCWIKVVEQEILMLGSFITPCPSCGTRWYILVNRMNDKKTHCWGPYCGSNPIYRIGKLDGKYGNYCNLCNQSLRTHPYFGEDKEYDIGNAKKFWIWKHLLVAEKNLVRRQYGF